MLGNFFLRKDGVAWFKVHGPIHLTALPEAVVENLTEGTFDYEIESAVERDGTLTAVMSAVSLTPFGKHKTAIPKMAAGESPAERAWCKLTITNATKDGLVAKVTLHGPSDVIVEVPAVEG